jgi:hypothetical protein
MRESTKGMTHCESLTKISGPFWKKRPGEAPFHTLSRKGMEWFFSVMIDILINEVRDATEHSSSPPNLSAFDNLVVATPRSQAS